MQWLVVALVLAFGIVSQATGQADESSAVNFEDVKAQAENGNVYAQERLALYYFLGNEGPEDDFLAFYWHRRAAEQGSVVAQASLGYRYEHGIGVVSQDIQKAIYWYRLAAQGGDPARIEDPISAYRLGIINIEGRGIQRDVPAAYWWFRKTP